MCEGRWDMSIGASQSGLLVWSLLCVSIRFGAGGAAGRSSSSRRFIHLPHTVYSNNWSRLGKKGKVKREGYFNALHDICKESTLIFK